MKNALKTISQFESYRLKNSIGIIGGHGDDPSEGDGKPKPPPPPPTILGPVVIIKTS